MRDYKKEVCNYVISNFLSGEGEIGYEDSLIKDGVIDSIDIMKLVTFLIKEYNLTLENEEYSLDNFDTIEKISLLLERKIGA